MKHNTLTGNKVFVKDGEPFEKALRRFKKKVEDSGLMEDLRKKECYLKPSVLRKTQKSAARARWLKKIRDNQLPKKMY